MWRTVLGLSVFLYAIVSHVTTAPTYYQHGDACGFASKDVGYYILKPYSRTTLSIGENSMKIGAVVFELIAYRTIDRRGGGLCFIISRGPSYTLTNVPEQLQRKPFIEVRNSTYHGSGPREEARAMCSVKTQEVNATANATITRRLHGVVTSRELHSSIQRLEVIIFGQMQQLWQSLDALRTQLTGRVPRSNTNNNVYPSRNTVSFRYQPAHTYQPHAL